MGEESSLIINCSKVSESSTRVGNLEVEFHFNRSSSYKAFEKFFKNFLYRTNEIFKALDSPVNLIKCQLQESI